MHLYEHQIATNASQQMTKVTEMVREDIERSGVREGIAVIFSPHTTAGFTINEKAQRILLGKEVLPNDNPELVRWKKYFRQNSSSTSMQKEIRMHI